MLTMRLLVVVRQCGNETCRTPEKKIFSELQQLFPTQIDGHGFTGTPMSTLNKPDMDSSSSMEASSRGHMSGIEVRSNVEKGSNMVGGTI